MPPMLKTKEELLESLNAKTLKTEGCWLYQGKLDSNGYGRISFMGKPTRIHRASAFIFLGLNLWDETQYVNHHMLCVNTNCWNPEHIYVGTAMDNMRDRLLTEGRSTCPQGHEYDMVNSRGKRDCSICRRESARRGNAKRNKMSVLQQ